MKALPVVSISIPDQKKGVLKIFDQLAIMEFRRRKGARSRLAVKAFEEYIDKHYPGNPQTLLFNQSKLLDPRRERAAINFLRFRIKLPIRLIANIVGRSTGHVYNICKKTGTIKVSYIPKNQKFPCHTYRKRFQAFMRGEYREPKEAFRFRG